MMDLVVARPEGRRHHQGRLAGGIREEGHVAVRQAAQVAGNARKFLLLTNGAEWQSISMSPGRIVRPCSSIGSIAKRMLTAASVADAVAPTAVPEIVTEAGGLIGGTVKSSIGIGNLLSGLSAPTLEVLQFFFRVDGVWKATWVSIQVRAEAPIVDVKQNAVTATITKEVIDLIPTGRNFLDAISGAGART